MVEYEFSSSFIEWFSEFLSSFFNHEGHEVFAPFIFKGFS